MTVRISRRQDDTNETNKALEERSHLVHRAGTANSGLFPGWGPKF